MPLNDTIVDALFEPVGMHPFVGADFSLSLNCARSEYSLGVVGAFDRESDANATMRSSHDAKGG